MSLSDIRSFLGLAGYYQRFFEGFSSIASPLTKLAHTKVKLQWLDECEKSFQTVKDHLMSATILALLEGLDGFFIYFHASRVRLVCSLMQNG